MRIIVGLGNPGSKYSLTRHNLGFMIVDQLATELGLVWQTNKKFKAELAKANDLLLIKPQTYMNLSGQSVAAILAYYKLSPEDLIIIHDDLDIDFGKYKLAKASRAAGHNGVQSIMDKLNTKNLVRYRIGVRNEMRDKIPAEKFVLEKFSNEELEKLKTAIPEISKIILVKK